MKACDFSAGLDGSGVISQWLLTRPARPPLACLLAVWVGLSVSAQSQFGFEKERRASPFLIQTEAPGELATTRPGKGNTPPPPVRNLLAIFHSICHRIPEHVYSEGSSLYLVLSEFATGLQEEQSNPKLDNRLKAYAYQGVNLPELLFQ